MTFGSRAPALALALLLAGLAAGCGDEPRKITRAESSQADPAPGPLFAGEVRLLGELAELDRGAFFVSVKAAQQPFPLLSKRYAVPDAAYERTSSGTRLSFALYPSDSMIPMAPNAPLQLPDELEIKISYSADGYVAGIRPDATLVAPIVRGATDVSLVLEPKVEEAEEEGQ